MLPVITKLFNEILSSGLYPCQWTEGYIVPIFKKNDKNDPSNYRGITITSAFSKLFNSILNERITNHFKKNNTIDECQIGFKKEARTSDHMFTLKSLIDKYISKGKNLYACFVDFKKAFDKINHMKLLYKLQKADVKGSVYNLLKDMYCNIKPKLSVKIGNCMSEPFESEIGLRQGDIMSPILFNLYVNDLIKEFGNKTCDPVCLHEKHINCLLYADDLILVSESEQGLQKCMDKLYQYSTEWDMELNLEKTEVLVFNKTGRFLKPLITFNKKAIKCTKEYKYLGLYFQSSGNFVNARKDLAQRASKAMFKLIKSFNGNPPGIYTCFHLFDHTIKPILMYGSELWGSYLIDAKKDLYTKWLSDEIEKCHLHFIRYILGVNRRTPKIAIYGETGRLPLLNEILCNVLKYWLRIRQLPVNSLLYNVYVSNVDIYPLKSWVSAIEILAQKLNIGRHDLLLSNIKMVQKVKILLKNTFVAKWNHDLFDNERKGNFGNKLRSYRLFKNSFRMESYLVEIKSQKLKKSLTKLRVGSHNLQIEKGRHSIPYKEPCERICKYCPNKDIEDEKHFIMLCPLYTHLRNNLYEKVSLQYPIFSIYDIDEKFVWLLSNVDPKVMHLLGNYVSECFIKRSLSAQV